MILKRVYVTEIISKHEQSHQLSKCAPLLLPLMVNVSTRNATFKSYSRQDALSPASVLQLVVLKQRAGTPKLFLPLQSSLRTRVPYSLPDADQKTSRCTVCTPGIPGNASQTSAVQAKGVQAAAVLACSDLRRR